MSCITVDLKLVHLILVHLKIVHLMFIWSLSIRSNFIWRFRSSSHTPSIQRRRSRSSLLLQILLKETKKILTLIKHNNKDNCWPSHLKELWKIDEKFVVVVVIVVLNYDYLFWVHFTRINPYNVTQSPVNDFAKTLLVI